jgi:hypothetical protein
MPTIVDFPTIVKDAVDIFGDLFANEPERRHFAEYLTGLMVAEKKTVSGINGSFVVTTDQSCLNRWLNEVTWDVQALNDRRLEWYGVLIVHRGSDITASSSPEQRGAST